jgi:hypothetical protein
MLVALRAGLIAALCFVAFTPAFSAEKSFKNSSLDNAVITLMADVKDEAGTVEKPVIALKKDADADLKSGNLEGAVDIYTQIVAVAPDDGQAWRRLANILIAIPPTDDDDGSTRYERATTAAYIAYQKATTPKDESDALITLASAYGKRSDWRPACMCWLPSRATVLPMTTASTRRSGLWCPILGLLLIPAATASMPMSIRLPAPRHLRA